MCKLTSAWLIRSALTFFVAALTAVGFAQNSSDPYNYDAAHPGGDFGAKVAVDRDGSIYVAGTGTSSTTGADFILVKYVVSGGALALQWARAWDDGGGNADTCVGLELDGFGHVYLGGQATIGGTSKLVVVGWDSGGSLVWSGDGSVVCSTPAATATGMTIDASGNLIVSGYLGVPSQGEADGIVWAVTLLGETKTGWPVTYGASSGQDEVFRFSLTSCG